MRGFVKLAPVSPAPDPPPKGQKRWAAKWTPDGRSITEKQSRRRRRGFSMEHGG